MSKGVCKSSIFFSYLRNINAFAKYTKIITNEHNMSAHLFIAFSSLLTTAIYRSVCEKKYIITHVHSQQIFN